MPLNLAEWYEMLKPIWQRNIASPLFDDSLYFFFHVDKIFQVLNYQKKRFRWTYYVSKWNLHAFHLDSKYYSPIFPAIFQFQKLYMILPTNLLWMWLFPFLNI